MPHSRTEWDFLVPVSWPFQIVPWLVQIYLASVRLDCNMRRLARCNNASTASGSMARAFSKRVNAFSCLPPSMATPACLTRILDYHKNKIKSIKGTKSMSEWSPKRYTNTGMTL
jgi:hypothetical protein